MLEMIIPVTIIFLLAFAGLSIGIIFGRKGISGSCSSSAPALIDIDCLCGSSESCDIEACDYKVSVKAICPDGDFKEADQLIADFEKKTGK